MSNQSMELHRTFPRKNDHHRRYGTNTKLPRQESNNDCCTSEEVHVNDSDGDGDGDGDESVEQTVDIKDHVTEFRSEMSKLSLAQVKKIKETVGIKLFNRSYFGVDNPTKQKTVIKARENPRRPREVSSKKPVSKFINIYPNEKVEKRRVDPRFNDCSGAYNDYIFKKNYDFLGDLRKNEKKVLMDELKEVKTRDSDRAEKLKKVLRTMRDREKTQKDKELHKSIIKEVRKENEDRMRRGEKPIYLTKGDMKRRYLEKKYEELKSQNNLGKYLERKARNHRSN